SGLEQAITAALRSGLDKAVTAKLITRAQEQKMLARMSARVAREINQKGLPRARRVFPPRFGPGAAPPKGPASVPPAGAPNGPASVPPAGAPNGPAFVPPAGAPLPSAPVA